VNTVTQPENRSAGFSISEWKQVNRNTLIGVFTLHLPSGMLIHGAMLHQKNGSRWIGLPAREYQLNGERKFARIIEFANKQTHEKFQASALAAVDAAGAR
jgi:hypothetical protein